MPAFRDSTFSYETTTTDAGLVIPVCANETNDLLIAVCIADTGALTTFTATPPSGWSILDEFYNSTPVIIYMKISGGSETDLTIASTTHATTNETYDGSMCSFRDIDTATPVGTANLSSYSESNQDSLQNIGDGTTSGVAQSFTTPAATATTNNRGCFARAIFYLKKVGSPTGNIVAKLYAHSGVMGTSSVPTGAALATSNNVDVSTLTGTLALTNFAFPATWYQFAANTSYVIALEYSGGNGSNYVQVGYDSSAAGHAGNKSTYNGSVWAAQATHDCCFYAQRFSFNMSTQAASARVNAATITTDVDNSLVVYLQATTASAGTTSFIEGPVTRIHGSDGSAEGHGMGWAYQKVAGTTPNNIYATQATTGTGAKGVAQIRPPASGATVIPAYVVSDSCQYIDPVQGTTGFNSNTGLAATADTNFGTTLGSYTANDATVAAVADVGINSFHSMGGMTNATTAGQVSGAEVVIAAANRFNLGTKNLLAHVRAATPAHMQRHATVAGGRGTWMGVRSNTGSGGATTGYKIWQVHGVGTAWGEAAVVPLIINNGAGNTKATSGTLDASVITSVGFWVSGIGTLTAQMCFGMIWLMDVTVIAGGNSSEPLDIEGIVRAVGNGKERISALQQGAKQMLLLQDVQIGDGGTNSVYLDLDATAIEFPRQYNAATKQVNYNSTDNKVGILYYPGSSDTIKHRNSIISSQSRYKWGLHSSASTSATYDFSGTVVVGAGTITLNKAITITELTINDYSTIDASGVTLDNCTITNPPAANDSFTADGYTNVDNSTINVSTVTSGNRWCSIADPSIFNTCSFTGGGGHAIRITTTGTYTLTSLSWTSFGADGSNGAAIYNDSGGAVTLNIVGGTVPTIRNGTSATTTLVINPVDVTVTVLDIDDNSPIAGARVLVLADSGGDLPADETVTITRSGSTATVAHTNHGLSSGNKVRIKGAVESEYNGLFTITVTGASAYTYTVSGTPNTPATGTILSSCVIIDGLTDAGGQITDNRSYSNDQPITGTVRKGTGTNVYKPMPLTGTVDSATGFSITVQIIPDV